MPRHARIEFASLHSSLVNLPVSLYGPLIERHVRPQSLAVHLSTAAASGSHVDAYVGWTGMAASSSLAKFQGDSCGRNTLETIEIDPQFAGGLGLRLGDIVEISLIHDLPLATSVTTEPITADDWEIVELHASYVEQNLLSQVRVASVGQEVDVWVFGRTRARLLVTCHSPQPGKCRAVLLSTNTEVSIAPKSRAPPTSKMSGKDTKSNSDIPSKSSEYTSRIIVRVLPTAFFSFETRRCSGTHRTAWVSSGTLRKLCKSNTPLEANAMLDDIVCRPVKAPDGLTSNEASSSNATGQSSRIIHESNVEKVSSLGATQEFENEKLALRWSPQVPDGQVVFDSLPSIIREWNRCVLSARGQALSFGPPDSISSTKNEPQSCLIGIDSVVEKCTNHLKLGFIGQQCLGKEYLSGILLTGRTGLGKTCVALSIGEKMERDSNLYAHIIHVDFSKHVDDKVVQVKAFLIRVSELASWHRPCILVFDNLDKLFSVEQEHAESFRNRQLADFLVETFRNASFDASKVALIATAESESSIHPRITASHLLKDIFKLKPPSREGRRDILHQAVCNRLRLLRDAGESPTTNINFTTLATQTEGYSPIDLNDLTSVAFHQATVRSVTAKHKDVLTVNQEDFDRALSEFTPLSLRDVKLQNSTVAWADIGGLKETRKILRETLEWPTKYSAIFAKCPLRLRSGILLYGYPGCGKTLLASAIAKECGLNFISVKGPEILNKYIGASEQSVRDLFDRASAAKPCVLFFDEFDAIAPKRGHDSTGVTDRVVNQMLTQMDGAEGLEGVYVLAATSRPDLIDPALLRPGRLDKSLLCDMPGMVDREEITQVVSRKISVAPSVNWREIALNTEGFSGADLQALIYNAHLDAVHASIPETVAVRIAQPEEGQRNLRYSSLDLRNGKAMISKAEEKAIVHRLFNILTNRGDVYDSEKQMTGGGTHHELGPGHLNNALLKTRPSITAEERARLAHIYNAYMNDRAGNLPSPPEEGATGSRVSLM